MDRQPTVRLTLSIVFLWIAFFGLLLVESDSRWRRTGGETLDVPGTTMVWLNGFNFFESLFHASELTCVVIAINCFRKQYMLEPGLLLSAYMASEWLFGTLSQWHYVFAQGQTSWSAFALTEQLLNLAICVMSVWLLRTEKHWAICFFTLSVACLMQLFNFSAVWFSWASGLSFLAAIVVDLYTRTKRSLINWIALSLPLVRCLVYAAAMLATHFVYSTS